MNDHELPNYTPDDDIRHVKRLWIYATGGGSGWLTDLKFRIIGHTEEDEDYHGGKEVNSVSQAYDRIAEFLEADGPDSARLVERTPLDFPIYKKCVVALKLYGNF